MRLRSVALVAVAVACSSLSLIAAEKKQGSENGDVKKKYNVEELRKKLAYQSITPRLSYESKAADRRIALPPEAKTTWQRIDAIDASPAPSLNWRNARAKALAKLHSDEVDEFVKREGNGFGRMTDMSPSPGMWERDDSKPIAFPKLPSLANESIVGVLLPPSEELADEQRKWPQEPSLMGYHYESVYNFLDPHSFGHVKDRENVAGFLSHQFRIMPAQLPTDPLEPKKERWNLRRLELISLLKHEQPVAYVSENLPRMDDLQKAKIRALSDFEAGALKSLANGEDLVAEATPNSIRMLGAVRATNSCLMCHDAQRGDLLGSFSYELQRDPLLTSVK